jgi:hypothetical protein
LFRYKTIGNRGNKNLVLKILKLLLITAFSLTACEPGVTIQIQNNTDETLSIFIYGYEGDVAPGETIETSNTWIENRYNIEGKNPQGEIVYERSITYEEMEKTEWKVVINTIDLKQ